MILGLEDSPSWGKFFFFQKVIVVDRQPLPVSKAEQVVEARTSGRPVELTNKNKRRMRLIAIGKYSGDAQRAVSFIGERPIHGEVSKHDRALRLQGRADVFSSR